jgi:hypothetical protein
LAPSRSTVPAIWARQLYPRLNPSETRFEYADNLSWNRGAHTMKFGIDIMHTQDYHNQLINRYGSFRTRH